MRARGKRRRTGYSPRVLTSLSSMKLLPLLIPWFKIEPWEIPGIGIKLQPFGLLVAIGILFGSRIAEWRGERTGVPPKLVADFLLYTIVFGLPMGMLLNMVIYEPHKALGWLRGDFSYPGMSSFGGFFAGTLAALWFRHKKRVSLMFMGDIFCYAFPFAWLFGRSGCFIVHDHPGIVSDFFLAVDNYNLQGEPRHDLGLYEVFWSAAMIPLVLWLGSKPRPAGFFMALVPLCYAPIRFFLDYLRETPEMNGDVRYVGLTPGQYGSLAITLFGLWMLYRGTRQPNVSVYLDGPPVAGHAPLASAKRTGRT
jgi:phosphatidylglycerol:prolipoprotein diacylglycerol transferase